MVRITYLERDRGDDYRHGTATGARRHSAAGEPPCDACRAAKAKYDKRQRSSSEGIRRNRLHAKAQQRALADLRRRYLDEYRELYLAHKRDLVAEEIRERGA